MYLVTSLRNAGNTYHVFILACVISIKELLRGNTECKYVSCLADHASIY